MSTEVEEVVVEEVELPPEAPEQETQAFTIEESQEAVMPEPPARPVGAPPPAPAESQGTPASAAPDEAPASSPTNGASPKGQASADPWAALVQIGAQVITAFASTGRADAPAHPWIERDPVTGGQNLKVPLPPPVRPRLPSSCPRCATCPAATPSLRRGATDVVSKAGQ